MSTSTPRRSTRLPQLPHTHTPKMSERKKGLFQRDQETPKESLTNHRRLPVVDSESDSEDCDLGIIGALDSSSGEDNDHSMPNTPERTIWHETRTQTSKLLKEVHDLKTFMKSPFTLKKYQTRYSCPDSKCSRSASTPATPHIQNHPGTPSSTHSCASVHTTSSTSSRARKSLASLIADTESCSSSLKDLNFDTDSASDSKENTPTSSIRRSNRNRKMTPKFQSFKGILIEQKKNRSPTKHLGFTNMDMTNIISPTQMLKTPQNTTDNNVVIKIGHNRRSVIEVEESPEYVGDSEKNHKRVRNDSIGDGGPDSKYPRLDYAPKARLSLFNSDRLKEILSAKSFYGKTDPDLNTNVTAKISHAIEASTAHHKRPFSHSHSNRRKRKPGQINSGVRHKIRKPKPQKYKNIKINNPETVQNTSGLNNSTVSNISMNDMSIASQNTSQELDKADPFDKEKQTIEALLSQWTEEEIPESELILTKPRSELPCFNTTIIEVTNPIFQPVTAVPVAVNIVPNDSDAVIMELGSKNLTNASHNDIESSQVVVAQMNTTGSKILDLKNSDVELNDVAMLEPEAHTASHGELPKAGQFLPVEGGYILVNENSGQGEEMLPDLDEIERELKMLDEQILKMAQSNNINPEAVLASTETVVVPAVDSSISLNGKDSTSKEDRQKLFSIFSKPNPGVTTPSGKCTEKSSKKCLLKNISDQYVIDAGQKKFGATQCNECGVIFQIGDPQDEHDHLVHHNATDVLKFPGWKEECIVGKSDTGRCIRVRGGDHGWKKVETLLARVVHPHFGYPSTLPRTNVQAYTAYLYVDKKQIVGCLVVETKMKAYKLLPGDPDCCSVEDYPVKCGVSRIWTHISHRRRGVAARLLDCARASFLYGEALRVTDIAFSSPTAAGKAFATKYCSTPNFYVYLD